ncbi:MAG: hypothetical protein H7067_09570 [Burkholderiales bacterium]|nr:hypothetical protein [Opitutaceae bacterium]
MADVAAGEKPEPVNPASGNPTNITYSHNLYFGGNIAPTLGKGDRIADPRFVNASSDPAVADFRLRPDSPARDAGVVETFSPYLDLDGRVRATPPTLGAYEKK